MVNEFDFSSYQSPIERVIDEVFNDFIEQDNGHLMAQIRIAVGYDINEYELIKALHYDRHQYEAGYADGRIARDREIILCRDCKKTDKCGEYLWCNELLVYNYPDDFCSRGERKEQNVENS